MPKGLNEQQNIKVNLQFTADAKEAQNTINNLKESLNSIANIPVTDTGKMNAGLKNAVQSARDLQKHLTNAYNMDTGNFDMKKLNASLKSSNQSLGQLSKGLLGAGLNGEKAFMHVQKAIAQSTVRIKEANGILGNFVTTLKNTARWQISSSVLHGFMGAMSSAYGYAKDLDASLNNIRIVTSKNTDEMRAFANEANKAAKALNTTTTKYTDASLIYYQQGLDDKEVVERTNATIKMANVTGDQATKVSDQLTAIWNNFDNGSKSLEYYADVITALGAATASSSSEIAQGLEKFSSIADMVGLSYEYATSALATVTAKTRQSADVVGTAFKTIFARIQGLKLGDTLEDGTDLNKYSEALFKVGINIKDQNGQLKTMDSLLDEMGAKWKTLDKDQQVALAQTVAGVRQYNQLVSLMDNWDFFESNLGVANTSAGTLTEQADIYAESWEAARKKVRASMETLYNELVPTDFIIDLDHGLAKVLDVVGDLIKGFGGLKNILLLISVLTINKMGPSIINGTNSIIDKVNEIQLKLKEVNGNPFKAFIASSKKATMSTEELKKSLTEIQNVTTFQDQKEIFNNITSKAKISTSLQAQTNMIPQDVNTGDYTSTFKEYAADMQKVYNLQGLLEVNADKLTKAEREKLSYLQEELIAINDKKAQEREHLEVLREERELLQGSNYNLINSKNYSENPEGNGTLTYSLPQEQYKVMDTFLHGLTRMQAPNEFDKITRSTDGGRATLISDRETLENYSGTSRQVNEALLKAINIINKDSRNFEVAINEAVKSLKITDPSQLRELLNDDASRQKLKSYIYTRGENVGISREETAKDEQRVVDEIHTKEKLHQVEEQGKIATKSFTDSLTQFVSKMERGGASIQQSLQAFSSGAMGVTMVSNAFKTLGDESASLTSKISAISFAFMGINQILGSMRIASGGLKSWSGRYSEGISSLLSSKNEKIRQKNQDLLDIQKQAEAAMGNKTQKEYKNKLKNQLETKAKKYGYKPPKEGHTEQRLQDISNFANTNKEMEKGVKLTEKLKTAFSTMSVGAKFGVIAAGVLAIVAAFKLLDFAIINNKEKIENLNEAHKSLSEQIKNAQAEVTQLNQSFEQYTSAIDNLEKMSAGMEGLKEATKEVSDQTLALLQQYPELAKIEGILKGEKGSYTLDEEKFEEFKNNKQNALNNLQGAQLHVDAKLAEAQYDQSISDFVTSKGIKGSSLSSFVMKDILKEGMEGASLEDAVNLGLKNYFGENLSGDAFENMSQRYISALSSSTDGFYEIINKQKEVANQLDIAKKLIVDNTLGKNASDEQKENFSQDYDKAYEDASSKWLEKIKNGVTIFDEADNAVLKEIQEILEKENPDFKFASKNAVLGFDGQDGFKMADGTVKQLDEIIALLAEIESKEKAEEEIRKDIFSTSSLMNSDFISNLSTEDLVSLDNKLNSIEDPRTKKQILDSLNGAKNEDAFKEIVESLIGPSKEEKAAVSIKDEVKKYDLNEEEVQNYSDSLAEMGQISKEAGEAVDGVSEDLADNAEVAGKIAVANTRMNKGLVSLAEHFNDYKEILDSSDKSSEEYQTALKGISDSMSDVLGLDDVKLSDSFLTAPETLNNIEAASQGSTEAVEFLRQAAAEDILVNAKLDDESFRDELISAGAELQQQLSAMDLKVGTRVELDDADAINALNNFIEKSKMSAEQVQDYFNALGYDPEMETKPVTQTTTHIGHVPQFKYGNDGRIISSEMVPYEWTEESEIQIPVIKAVNYHGGANNTVNTAKVKKASSKGGKSGGKSRSKKETKDASDEIERYHQIEKEIDVLNNQYSELGKEKDQVFGKKKIKYIDEEIKAIDKLQKKQEQYIKDIVNNAAKDMGAILNYGFTFDENGTISNWEAIMTQQLNKYNDAIKSYNSGSMSEGAFAVAERKYEDFKKLVSQYEETNELLDDALEEAAELERQRIEKELEKITVAVDFDIEIKERDLKLLDYTVDKFGNELNKAIELIDALGEKANNYSGQATILKQGITDIYQNAEKENRPLTDDENRQIWEYQDQLLEINNNINETIKTIGDSLLEEFDKLGDKIDSNISKFDQYNSVLDHYKNIIQLSGRETKDATLLQDLMNQKIDIAMQKYNAANDKFKAYQKALAEAKEKLESASGKDEIEYWTNQVDELTNRTLDAQNEMLQNWEDSLSAAGEAFEQAIEATIQKLKDSISEYGLDNLSDRYEKAKMVQDRYLSDLDKEYELNRLINQVEDSLNKTDNLKAQEEYNKMLQDLNEKKKDGVKISSYDVEYAKKELEVLQAKYELEQKQNNATQMRLVRNDQGSYDYVYTADQSEVDAATQNYEDKLYELKKMSEDHIREISDLIIQNQQEMTEALANIDRNRFETKEAYEAEVARITEYYLSQDMYLRQELDKAVVDSGLTYQDTILGQLENASTWEEAHENLKENTNEATDTMIDKWQEWKDRTEEAMNEVGSSSETLESDIKKDMENIEGSTNNLSQTIDKQVGHMKDYIQSLINKVADWRNKHVAELKAMIQKNEEFITSINSMVEKQNSKFNDSIKNMEKVKNAYIKNIQAMANSHKGLEKSYDHLMAKDAEARAQLSRGWPDPPSPPPEKTKRYKYKFVALDGGGTILSGSTYSSRQRAYDAGVSEYYRRYGASANPHNAVQVYSFATGGYTGQWGPEGKLAMLHEKELILNKHDTANMLTAVEAIRSIGPELFNNIRQILNNNVIEKTNLINSINVNSPHSNDGKTPIEQNVVIQADFPGVSTAVEIENALHSLINDASQRVNMY